MRLSKIKTNKFNAPPLKKIRTARVLCFLTLVFCLTGGSFLIERNTFSAGAAAFLKKPQPTPTITNIDASPTTTPTEFLPSSTGPPQTSAERLNVVIGETRDFPFPAELNSVVVVSPEVAAAQIKNPHALTVRGVKIGETILIISVSGKRLTFIVQVTGKPADAARAKNIAAERSAEANAKTSGSLTVNYVPGFDGGASIGRNNIWLTRKLSAARTLRISGEMLKTFGGESNQSFVRAQNFGLNRLSIGVDSPEQTIDFFDSRVSTSTAGINGFEMRGFHLVKTPSISAGDNPQRKGVEIFAGLARSSDAFYSADSAKIVGAMLPFAEAESWQARAGLTTVVAGKNKRGGRGGTVLQLAGTFAPDKKFWASGEVDYSLGSLSWQARANLKLEKFGAFGEIVRFDKNSPLAGVGALSGGRENETLALYWRPDARFNFSVNLRHANVERRANSLLTNFSNTTFSAQTGYKINRNSRVNFRFLDQRVETSIPGGGTGKFQIATRSFGVNHNVRFNKNWSNDLETRLNFSREAHAATELEKGFYIREQLRFSWSRNYVSGYLNYTNNTPSLTSLILRNPGILPAALQSVFVSDPNAFLRFYRDRIAFLLPGIELPQTRGLDAGAQFQTTFSRFTAQSEIRYAGGRILSQNQSNISAFVGLNVRLDAANSFQINGSRQFGANGQTAIAFSFTHLFGGDSGGFQFSKLLGLDRGKIRGRVYYDLNGNGRDESGEPGAAGLTVRLDEQRSVKTDEQGRYQFSAPRGAYNLALISEDLGVRLRASTATEQQIRLSARQTAIADFGVVNFGLVSGRIVNDANQSGLCGVKVLLRSSHTKPENFPAAVTDCGGTYEFRNLRPGDYLLELDAATLPANFRLPTETSWEIKIQPLQAFYLDVPITARRAVAGVVFIDRDADGKFDPQTDEAIEGASVTANDIVGISDRGGAYLLRNLPAGKIKISVRPPFKMVDSSIFIELGSEPTPKRAFNIAVRR